MQLGISAGNADDKPVIMSGHQAAFWHMGIAAKWLALHEAGECLGASTAWVVVDHDPEDFSGLSVPVRNASATLRAESAIGDRGERRAGSCVGLQDETVGE